MPGKVVRVYQDGTAMRLPAGSTLIFQMHYTTTGKATTDRTSIGLKFAKSRRRPKLSIAALINGVAAHSGRAKPIIASTPR